MNTGQENLDPSWLYSKHYSDIVNIWKDDDTSGQLSLQDELEEVCNGITPGPLERIMKLCISYYPVYSRCGYGDEFSRNSGNFESQTPEHCNVTCGRSDG